MRYLIGREKNKLLLYAAKAEQKEHEELNVSVTYPINQKKNWRRRADLNRRLYSFANCSLGPLGHVSM
jgi:hypothetical protein